MLRYLGRCCLGRDCAHWQHGFGRTLSCVLRHTATEIVATVVAAFVGMTLCDGGGVEYIYSAQFL